MAWLGTTPKVGHERDHSDERLSGADCEQWNFHRWVREAPGSHQEDDDEAIEAEDPRVQQISFHEVLLSSGWVEGQKEQVTVCDSIKKSVSQAKSIEMAL